MMLSGLTDRVRAFAYRKLEGKGQREGARRSHPLIERVREVASTVNDLLGRPIRPVDQPIAHPVAGAGAAANRAGAGAKLATRAHTPVLLYFDGRDHRTKAKVEELLRAREIGFQVVDVTNDEAERSWIITAAKRDQLPIVVVGGVPVGGFDELTQLDVTGELRRRVFGD